MNARGAGERYLPQHIHESLLADERVGEQDLQVRADEHCLYVSGTVPTQARRDAIVTVITELAPGWEICNEVELIEVASAPDSEDVV